jgi:hypothetical protein
LGDKKKLGNRSDPLEKNKQQNRLNVGEVAHKAPEVEDTGERGKDGEADSPAERGSFTV